MHPYDNKVNVEIVSRYLQIMITIINTAQAQIKQLKIPSKSFLFTCNYLFINTMGDMSFAWIKTRRERESIEHFLSSSRLINFSL